MVLVVRTKGVDRGGFLDRLAPLARQFSYFDHTKCPKIWALIPLEIQKSPLENIMATPLVRLSVVQQ